MDAMSASLLVPADGRFDTIAGLPLHPLVVHIAVVLLPLAALGLIVLVLVPRWRATYGWLTLAGLAVGTAGAFVAKESGEALAARVGLPQRHAELGDVLPLVAGLLFVVAVVWFVADRRRRSSGQPGQPGQGALVLTLGIASALLAVGTIGLTVAVGHSGAEAVWGRTTQTPPPAPTPDAVPTPDPSGSTTPTTPDEPAASEGTAAAATYTLDEVAERFTPEECWTVIDGTVYDLTAWIAEHPGGGPVIESLCGIDGTVAFDAEHGGQGEPLAELAQFAIGSVSSG
jgi:uncharacterized membrane protein